MGAKDVIVGTDLGSGFIVPFQNSLFYSTTQSIYRREEIGHKGTITSLYFYVSKNSEYQTNSVKIYMGQKESATFADINDFFQSDKLTEVYSGAPTIGAQKGWEEFELTTPYEYDGNNNLVIVVCHQARSINQDLEYQYTYYSGSNVTLERSSMTNSSVGTIDGSSVYTARSWRANIKLTFDGEKGGAETGWEDIDLSDYCVDGIHYSLDTSTHLATVIKETDDETNYSKYPSSTMVIPSVIYCNNTMFVVRYIDKFAFAYNTTIKEVKLGNNIMFIGDYAFYKNTGLTKINIPSLVKNIPSNSFLLCSNLSDLSIEKSADALTLENRKVYNVKFNRYNYYGTFENCPLENVEILRQLNYSLPNLGNVIGWYEGAPFGQNPTLRSVVLGEDVTSIGKYMFYNCANLQDVTISGKGLTKVDDYAFCYCAKIKSLRFPETTKYFGIQSLRGLSAKPIIFLGKGLECCDKFLWEAGSSVIWAYNSELETIKHAAYSNLTYLYDIDNPIIAHSVTPYLKAIDFDIDFGECFFIPGASIQSISYKGNALILQEDGHYHLENLEVDNDYYIDVVYTHDEIDANKTQRVKISTLRPKVSVAFNKAKTTQTTLALRCDAEIDKTCMWSERGIIFNSKKYIGDEYGKVALTGLNPGTEYEVKGYAIYGAKTICSDAKSFQTKDINLDIEGTATPTSIKCTGIYDAGDSDVIEYGFNNGNVKGEKLVLTGLEPNTEYSIIFYVCTPGGYSTSVSKTFTTTALELTTLDPNPVTETNTIVAAETNIAEEETSVGFQWRKYDAPESLKPSEGYAAIYGGHMEGLIKNLQPTSYYNVRAFYKSTAGIYYYGNWVTFDPGDFSYFEPIVHTYSQVEVSKTSAKVKGYVLQGSEDVIEQGIQYWRSTGSNASAKVLGKSSAADMNTAYSTGQVMDVTLDNLSSGTTYYYRAFATTATGTTFGEEMSFTTEGTPTGIECIDTNDIDVTVERYYDLNGRRLNVPKRGINIIRMSNGKCKKIFVK